MCDCDNSSSSSDDEATNHYVVELDEEQHRNSAASAADLRTEAFRRENEQRIAEGRDPLTHRGGVEGAFEKFGKDFKFAWTGQVVKK